MCHYFGQILLWISDKPLLSDSTSVFLSRIGGEARLECTFSAYPLEGHEFHWYRLPAAGDAQKPEEGGDADATAREEVCLTRTLIQI